MIGLSPDTTISHYRIISQIGAGGMGEVYLAEDMRLERRVAIKLLPAEVTKDSSRVRRFEQEARAASALNHPNIVTIHEIGEVELGHFIVLEYVKGTTLRAIIESPQSVQSIAPIGRQIARALGVAHEAKIIHRDIKPENIMVRDDGYVKVLDFGLARLGAADVSTESSAQTAIHTRPGSLVGTLAYMSPEQVKGEAVEGGSDIFSLGIIFYEMATGQKPFKADSEVAVMHAIAYDLPAPPSRLNPDLPPPLEQLILAMLDKNPRLRPTAVEVASALAVEEQTISLTSNVITLASRVPETARNTVGREMERDMLRAAFESAGEGRGLMVCINGEAGLGKTTLVEDFLAEIAQTNSACQIARGKSSERLAGAEAYLPFLEMLENLTRKTSGRPLARLMKAIAPAWYLQLATSQDSSIERVIAESPTVSQERMKRELAAFLQEVSSRGPLVLFFDDLHWADASTIDIIAYIATKLASMRLLIVAAYRSSEMQVHRHPFLRVKLDMQGRGLCHELSLDFLTAEDVERYLALEFPNHRFPKQFASLIYGKTEGSPLFMADVVRYLRDRKVIGESGGGWTLVQTVPEIETDLPETVRSMIQRKIAQLSEEDRSLLVGASVQGYEFDSTLVARALDLDPADVEERLESLDRVYALVRLVAERDLPGHVLSLRYRFVHVLYQNTLYMSLRPTRRAQISAAVAESMLAFYDGQSATVASELAFLFEAARNWSRASDHYLIAAQNAAEVFANQEAAGLAQRGLKMVRLLADTSARARQELKLQMTLGPSLMAARGFAAPEVEQTFLRAAELCLQLDDRVSLFRAQFSLAITFVVKAEYHQSSVHAEQCLRLAEELRKPAMLTQSHWVLGLSECYLGRLGTARDHFEQTILLNEAEAVDSPVSLYGGVLSRAHQARMMLYLGYPDRSRQLIDEATLRSERLRHPIGSVNTFSLAAQMEAFHGNAQATKELADAITQHSEEHGLPYYAAVGTMMRGWALAMCGEPETGIELLREGLASYLATGTRQQQSYFLTLMAEALDEAGRAGEAFEALTEAMTVAIQSNERYYEAEMHRLRGEISLKSEGALSPEAEACFQQAIKLARDQQAKSFELRAAISLSRMWRQQGKQAEAHAILSEIYGWFTEGFATADLKDAKMLLSELAQI